jgi:hypothetical protein
VPGLEACARDQQNCAKLHTVNGLDDLECSVPLEYVCECDGYPDNL